MQSTGSRCVGFSSYGWRASVVMAGGLQSTGSVVVAHGLSCSAACGTRASRTRARTHVPCIGRRIPNHCTTREVPIMRYKITYVRVSEIVKSECDKGKVLLVYLKCPVT